MPGRHARLQTLSTMSSLADRTASLVARCLEVSTPSLALCKELVNSNNLRARAAPPTSSRTFQRRKRARIATATSALKSVLMGRQAANCRAIMLSTELASRIGSKITTRAQSAGPSSIKRTLRVDLRRDSSRILSSDSAPPCLT